MTETRRLSAWLCAPCLVLACIGCSDSNNNEEPEETPATPLLSAYQLGSPDSVPEGVAFDPVDRAFYATSLQGASITRIAADGSETLFREADNRAQLLGAKVDAQARRLWVCARDVDGIDSRVWVFDLDSGEQVMEFLLAALATNGGCNDLALDDAGIAYVTDSSNPNIYQLNPQTGLGSVLISDPLLADTFGIGLGLNGIAVSDDQTRLIVGKFLPAQLLGIALPEADRIWQISLDGDALPSPDGLVFAEGDLYAVSGGSVSRLVFAADFGSATVVNRMLVNGLSTAAVAEGAVYAIKSDVTNFVLGLALSTPFEILRIDLSSFD